GPLSAAPNGVNLNPFEPDTQSCGKPLWKTLWKLWRTRPAPPVGTVKYRLWKSATWIFVYCDWQKTQPWHLARNGADLLPRNSSQVNSAHFTVSLRAFDNQT